MRRLAAVLATLLLAGCTTAGLEPSPRPPAGAPIGPSPSNEPSPSFGESPSFGQSPVPSLEQSPVAAARALLDDDLVRVSMRVERAREGEEEELLITVHGLLDPAADRGFATVDVSGLLAGPDGSPITSPTVHELAWDAGSVWAEVEPDGGGRVWARLPREEAPDRGGLLGRMPNELVALLRLVAAADEASVAPLGPATIDGRSAARFLVTVTATEVVAQRIPAPFMTEGQFRETYRTDEVGVEAMLVDGRLRRIILVLERERALYGGPDLTETITDWAPAEPGDELVLPPPGRIEER